MRAVLCFLPFFFSAAWGASRPILFEPNLGQAAGAAQFVAHARQGLVLLTPGAAVFHLPGKASVSLAPLHGNPHPLIAGEDSAEGVSNYLRGRDPHLWVTGVPHFRRVRYRDVYPGIDQVFYGADGVLEYDLIVRPGADPRAIRLRVEGARRLSLNAAGDLSIDTQVVQHRPVVYQEIDGARRHVAGRFALAGREVRFVLGEYDRTLPLVIDPAVIFSSYLGGSTDDLGTAVAVDSSGSAYVAGYTESVDFPVTANALQVKGGTPNAGAMELPQSFDAFVTKFSPDGSRLIYSTYLGGSGNENALTIAVDAAGNAVVGGLTSSPNFPVTSGALQTAIQLGQAGFISKLNATGSNLIFSTYLGGPTGTNTSVASLALDKAGNVYATGSTNWPAFPVTPGALQTTYGGGTDAFVAKLNPLGTALVYSTFLGGKASDQATAIAVDAAGNAYIAGGTYSTDFPVPAGSAPAAIKAFNDSFVCKLNAAGTALIYAAFLGGSQNDTAAALALDSDNSAVFTGTTNSPDFPVTPGAFQTVPGSKNTTSFVARLDPTGAVAFATYLGGTGIDNAHAIAVAADGSAIVGGLTESRDFPVTPDAYQHNAPLGFGCGTFDIMFTNYPVPCSDAFLTIVHVSGRRLIYSTFLGGEADDSVAALALGTDGAIYLTGFTGSDDFPATAGAFRTTRTGGTCSVFASPSAGSSGPCDDAFLMKIDPSVAGPPRLTAAIVNAVNAVAGPVAPGEFVSLFGFGIGPAQQAIGQIGGSGSLPTALNGTSVAFDGVPAPLLYAGPNQINAVVPYTVAGKSSTTVSLTNASGSANVSIMPVGPANPGLMSLGGTGQGQAAALNQDGSINGAAAPAARGSVISLFGDGAGMMSPAGTVGTIAPGISQVLAPVTVAIGGVQAQVTYAGAAPGLLQGIVQVNAVVPPGVSPGSQVPVTITVSGVTSQVLIYLAVK